MILTPSKARAQDDRLKAHPLSPQWGIYKMVFSDRPHATLWYQLMMKILTQNRFPLEKGVRGFEFFLLGHCEERLVRRGNSATSLSL